MNVPIANQVITATIALAGRQHPTIDTHGTGEPGSMITVIVGTALIRLHDQLAVATYTQAWTTFAARHYGPKLPESRELTAANGAEPAITVEARGQDQADSFPGDGFLVVRIGRLSWAVYDRQAYTEQVETWTTISQLSEIVLPRHYDGIQRGPSRRP